jgi:hypothetical protein
VSKIDGEKLLQHLKTKWGGRSCPMCGVGPWSVQDAAYEVRAFGQGGLLVGGAVIPVVPVVCMNCGNTVLVNAILAGVVKQKPEEGPK